MREVKTKLGVFFVEEADEREEAARIKIYDSLGRYFDYFSIDCLEEGETPAGLVNKIVDILRRADTVQELLDSLGIPCEAISTDWRDMLEPIGIQNDETYRLTDGKWVRQDGKVVDADYVLKNEWVNVIGETYIFVAEM